jgi:hypothetical protein
MAQHRLKTILVAGGFIATLAVGVCGDAYAFTESTVPTTQPQVAQPSPSPLRQVPDGGKELPLSDPGNAKSGGTELRIPGLGSLGTLPKLDFGLDLLYDNGNDPVREQRPLENENQDVTIKGTLRHRF